MRLRFFPCAAAGSVLIAASSGAAARVEPKTEAAVIAADDEWAAAERLGDVARVDARLADGYEDVAPDGQSHPKARLLAAVASLKPEQKAVGTLAEVAAAFRKQHPVTEKVVIVGDTAILTFHSIDPTLAQRVRAADVFVYERGMWRALLSMHASAPPPAAS